MDINEKNMIEYKYATNDNKFIKKSQPIDRVLLNSKFQSPIGVNLDGAAYRLEIDRMLKVKAQMPAPNSYVSVKSDSIRRKLSRNELQRGTTSGVVTGYSEDLEMGYERQFKNNGKTVFGK